MATVKGLAQFQRHFAGFENEYVLIGGVACHLWFQENALNFRATKDLDVVLVSEALTPEFVKRFWLFIEAGRYATMERSDRTHKYYRFTNAKEPDFPHMIELFTRLPDGLDIASGQTTVPIPMDEDVSSLSAILLDEEYYHLIREHRHRIENLPLIAVEVLIPLKAKAWLDLSRRRESGEAIDSSHVAKHRSDVFRLALLLHEGMRLVLPDAVAQDMQRFLEAFPVNSPQWGGIRASLKTIVNFAPSAAELRETIAHTFGLSVG